MRCPIDEETLVISDRQGIEIDYCPKCRGVWLDRGELDKLIEREAERYEGAPSRSGQDEVSAPFRKERDWDDDDDDRRRLPGHKRKKSAWSGRSRGSHEMLWGPAGRGRRFLIGAV